MIENNGAGVHSVRRHIKNGMKKLLVVLFFLLPLVAKAQFNTDRLVTIGRSALYYEDYVLSIQYFNKVITVKPYMYEPWFFRAVAKYNLDDFPGAERDCDEAIERNPYVTDIYELRGLTRIRQNKFGEAIDDYNVALKYSPENRSLWYNKVLCKINRKDYDGALNDVDTILTKWKMFAKGYALQGEIFLLRKDTIDALAAFDKAMEIDPYDASVWSAKSIVTLARQEWEASDSMLTEAIRLQPKQAGLYVNRALARVNRNNLRGAMADYDTALDIDPSNFLGHYNRGLLRAQVGDDNRAITDFDFVLKMEPDNYMALYNRALLREKTGDLRGAVSDYTKVIDNYPSFWAGLQSRAACYRRLGMVAEAERDEFKVYKEQLYKRLYGTKPRLDKKKQRKRSDTDPDKYNQLVVDDGQDMVNEYSSDYRGRVQNRKASMSLLPMYSLSFEQLEDNVADNVRYDRNVADYNNSVSSSCALYVSNGTGKMEEKQSADYFAYIEKITIRIEAKPNVDTLKTLLMSRSVAYSMINDYGNAKEDLTTLLMEDSTFVLAYWQRAICQSKMNEFDASLGTDVAMRTANVLADLSAALKYSPQSEYLYYNRGNVHASRKDYDHAIKDYTAAIEFDNAFAAAYYNRGVVKILMNDIESGVADLSKAGELGLYSAYSIIKKYANQRTMQSTES